jgi:hypothetical protein
MFTGSLLSLCSLSLLEYTHMYLEHISPPPQKKRNYTNENICPSRQLIDLYIGR